MQKRSIEFTSQCNSLLLFGHFLFHFDLNAAMMNMDAQASSPFEILFSKNVPHILENIFLSVDFESFKNCLVVNTTWNGTLTSELFLNQAKSAFREEWKKLITAAEEGNYEEVGKLLSFGIIDVNGENEHGETAVFKAALKGHKDIVQLLIDRGADLNKTDKSGYTPIYVAVVFGREDVVKLLLDNGENPNNALERHWTPLHVAVIWNRKDVIRVLLDRGADPNMTDNLGDTAQSYAQLYGYRDIVNMLE